MVIGIRFQLQDLTFSLSFLFYWRKTKDNIQGQISHDNQNTWQCSEFITGHSESARQVKGLRIVK